MEFKFRDLDVRSRSITNPPLPSSTLGCFSSSQHSASDGFLGLSTVVGSIPYPLLQLEKEQIRREIIAADIMWRQILEAQVRMELTMEREMAMRRVAGQGFPLMELDPNILPHPNTTPLDRAALAKHGASIMSPAIPPAMVPAGVIPPSMANKNTRKALAEQDPNLLGPKRKAATLSAVNPCEAALIGLGNKPNSEWSCALCQVSATSESGLNAHLQGKKHKAREAGLRAHKMAKKSGGQPVKTDKVATKSTSASKPEGEDEKSLEMVGGGEGDKNQEEVLKSNKNAQDVQKNNGREVVVQRIKRSMPAKKKTNFWCDLCRVGTNSQVNLKIHENGKKHRNQLKKSEQQTTVVAETTKNAGLIYEGKNQKATDNVSEETMESTEDVSEETMGSTEDACRI